MKRGYNRDIDEIKESICRFYLDHKKDCDLHYKNAEKKELGNIYVDVTDDREIQNLFLEVAIVIITANKYEKNVLHHNIYCSKKEKIKRIEIALFPERESKGETYAYWFKWKDYVVLHIEAQNTGSYTKGGSADITRYIVNSSYIFPAGIISFGICFGTDEKKYQLGDVIISRKIYPYFMGAKITEAGYFVDDDNMFRISTKINAKIKAVKDKNAFSKLKQEVYLGNYITGEAVISRKKARDEFVKSTTQVVLAGEMEGYGLFKECGISNYPVPCLVVKSICDWAVNKNFDAGLIFKKISNSSIKKEEIDTIKDRLQAYAVYQSFCVFEILLSNKIFGDSVYNNVIKSIKNISESGIYARYIKTYIGEWAKEYTFHAQIPNEFIIALIKKLINEKWILAEHFELEENMKKAIEKVWNCFLPLNREKSDVEN